MRRVLLTQATGVRRQATGGWRWGIVVVACAWMGCSDPAPVAAGAAGSGGRAGAGGGGAAGASGAAGTGGAAGAVVDAGVAGGAAGAPVDAAAPASDGPADEWDVRLADRRVDYPAALRIAALRLVGNLPTLAEIKFVADAQDRKSAYEAVIDQYLADPRFAPQVLSFFRDTFKMGGSPLLESAPTFAAELVVSGRPLTELFTATSGNCPSYDAAMGQFVSKDCDNGVPAHAGVLTNPGVMAQFYSNLAFRRVRWVQETFACTRFPAESAPAQMVGGRLPYTTPWPFASISGMRNGGRVDFLDTSSVICANCHATMNHVAPLFGNFDEMGLWQGDIVVKLPLQGTPVARLGDWLPAGQATAWRFGEDAADLPALGRALARDPDVAVCSVVRAWNWAFGKGDIVTTVAQVPGQVVADHVALFVGRQYDWKEVLAAVFKSDDFVRF